MDTILALFNSKKRVVYTAIQDSLGIKIDYECGGGYANKPEDCFLSAACTWLDNPSCKIGGKYSEEFKQYCLNTSWAKHLVK
jgi:hypothetical protein